MTKASLSPPEKQSENQCAPLTKRAMEKSRLTSHTVLCIESRLIRGSALEDLFIILDKNKDQMRFTAACSPGQLKVKRKMNIR